MNKTILWMLVGAVICYLTLKLITDNKIRKREDSIKESNKNLNDELYSLKIKKEKLNEMEESFNIEYESFIKHFNNRKRRK